MITEPILFTQQQYELLQMGLTIIMKAAQQEESENNEERFREAAELSSALEQNMMKGEGMSLALRQRFEKRIAVAQKKGDSQAATRALRDFLAALVRVEPDPAKAVANTCMTAMMRANMSQAAGIFIPTLQRKLVGLQTDYQKEGYPEAQAVLDYLNEWLAYGKANLENGEEPWPEDEHFSEPS